MYLFAVAATTMAALPPLPCALDGQTYTPASAGWRFAGPATFNRRFPIGDPAMVTSNMTAASAMHQAVATAGGAWLVGSVNGGVWRTKDVGSAAPSWEPVTDGQPVRCSSISALSAARSDASLVFAGCGGSTSSEQGTDWNVLNDGDWGGVMFSRDGGSSWAMTSFPVGYYVTGVLATGGAIELVVSARSSFLNASAGGVWVGSRNGTAVGAGADPLASLVWAQTLHQPVYNLQDVPTAATIFAAVPMAAGAESVMASRDGGATWSAFGSGLTWPGSRVPFYPCFAATTPLPNATAAAAAAVATLFVGALTRSPADPLDTDSAIFHRPADGSAPWRAVPHNLRQDDDQMPKDRMALLADPQDPSLLYVAGNGGAQPHRVAWATGVWEKMWGPRGPARLDPHATHYTSDGSAPHGDCRNWAWRPGAAPGDPGSLVLTSDGGIFERDRPRGALDAGRWRSLNGDIGAMEFYSAHWDAAGERWIGGAQDNDVQVAPERCGASDVALGINFGDGTSTATDNSVSPTRLFGTTQFYGQRDDDGVRAARKRAGLVRRSVAASAANAAADGRYVAFREAGDDDALGDDDDDPNDQMTTSPQGMLMWSKNASVGHETALAIPLTKWFPFESQFPLFVQPFALNLGREGPGKPLVIWANGSAARGGGGGKWSKSGFWQVELPPGLSDPDDVAEPALLAEVDARASVLAFAAGGVTAGRRDEAALVAVNGTHFYHRSAPAGVGDPLTVKRLPTTFAEPDVLRYNASDGTPFIGPVSHGQTVFLAVHPGDSRTSAVTGWHSVRDNTGAAGADGVWLTADAGDTWRDVTGDLAAATATVGRPRPSGLLLLGDALLVGTVSGVFVSWPARAGAGGSGGAAGAANNRWSRLGLCKELPLVLVMALSHEPTSDTLVAATFGRGVYVLANATQALGRLERIASSSG